MRWAQEILGRLQIASKRLDGTRRRFQAISMKYTQKRPQESEIILQIRGRSRWDEALVDQQFG
jgi:hypothetical protein